MVDLVIPGGRPDVVKLVKEVYNSWGAEVVFITSNWAGNQELMEGCKSAGIPAFVSTAQLVGSFSEISDVVFYPTHAGYTLGFLMAFNNEFRLKVARGDKSPISYLHIRMVVSKGFRICVDFLS